MTKEKSSFSHKIYPTPEAPSEADYTTAMEMVEASRPSGVYTDEERKEINSIARTIMMKRIGATVQ